MKIKENISLIFAISIPVLMVVFVALSIYIPQLYVKPGFDFLYLTGNNYNCNPQPGVPSTVYYVQDNRLIENIQKGPQDKPCFTTEPLQILLHNTKTNENKEVSFESVKNLDLNSSFISPDGFQIENGSRGGGGFFPFFLNDSYDYNSHYITGHGVSKKINIQQPGSYYNFNFLGWVIR